jgi:hypothetical protein
LERRILRVVWMGRKRRGWEVCLRWDGWERKSRRIIKMGRGEGEKKFSYMGNLREGYWGSFEWEGGEEDGKNTYGGKGGREWEGEELGWGREEGDKKGN